MTPQLTALDPSAAPAPGKKTKVQAFSRPNAGEGFQGALKKKLAERTEGKTPVSEKVKADPAAASQASPADGASKKLRQIVRRQGEVAQDKEISPSEDKKESPTAPALPQTADKLAAALPPQVQGALKNPAQGGPADRVIESLAEKTSPQTKNTASRTEQRQETQLKAHARSAQAPGRGEDSEEKKFTIIDRRSETKDKHRAEDARGSAAFALEAKNDPSKNDVRSDEDIKIVFQTGQQIGVEGSGSRVQAPVSREAASQLARHLQEKSNAQIVDRAQLILKDHNQGEIKLVLYPESLGKVRINLSMSENHLEGRIFVENNTVKEVFQNNMENLTRSFKEGGFANLSLDVSVGGQQNPNREASFAASSKSYGGTQAVVEDGPQGGFRPAGEVSDRLVNLVV